MWPVLTNKIKKLDDYRLKLGKKEYVPIMLGGMGMDISTAEMAIEVSMLGGIGHISDAMIHAVADRRFHTHFVKDKYQKYKQYATSTDKSEVQFDLKSIEEATKLHVGKTMDAKKGDGAIFVNCMEKLTMNNPRETLKIRMASAMDAGIDGITLSAGLHLGSFEFVSDHPRFRDVKLGIIVSSLRALKLFLRRAKRLNRLPDYVVVEGPLAGGHLGFGIDNWREFSLKDIVIEILQFTKSEGLDIPIIPAGGIFTGTDGVELINMGASAIQVANRFTVTEECGLPYGAKQEYFRATIDDVVVNSISPTGYPMRMLKNTPAINSRVKPNCEGLGYLLDNAGKCSYLTAYNDPSSKSWGTLSAAQKTCLCTHMKNFKCWTCGHYVYRLKDSTNQLPDGSYQILTTRHVFEDYQFSENHEIKKPLLP